MTNAVHTFSAKFLQSRPEVRPGFTVRVHERIQEGGKERIQVFEGLVIAVHKGSTPTDSTFTVRRIASGIGVERVFSLHSPKIEKIEVKKVARVRRAKLFFLRGRRGKAARLSERFTTADEFAVATPVEPEPVAEEDVAEAAPEAAEAPAEEVKEDVKEEVKEEAKEEPKKEEEVAKEPAPEAEAPKEEKSASAEATEDKKED
jgi:large subunit ribosomal protein L19